MDESSRKNFHKIIVISMIIITAIVLISVLDHVYAQPDHGIEVAQEHVTESPASQEAVDAINEQYDRVFGQLTDEVQEDSGGRSHYFHDSTLDPEAPLLPSGYAVATKHHAITGEVDGTIGVFHIDYPKDTELTILGIRLQNLDDHIYFPDFPIEVHDDVKHVHENGDEDQHGWMFYSVHTRGHEIGSIPFDIYFEIDEQQYRSNQVVKFHDIRNHNVYENIEYWLDQLFYDEQGELRLFSH